MVTSKKDLSIVTEADAEAEESKSMISTQESEISRYIAPAP